MIIRELVTTFGIDFDESGAKQAKQGVDSLQNALKGLGIGLSFAGVYAAFSNWLGAASSVEEEMNVITQTFGESTEGVLEWAKVNSEAMNRSEFDLRKYAGQLGAVLAPMLGTKEAAAQMSEQLAALAVDLGSFFNKDDEETMGRLRSGILGSTEAVDQLGINLRQEHVEAVMAAEGITKNWKALTEAEKVQYRFLTIMKDTIDKQGDAARTADSYANSLKAGEANVQKIAVALGDRLMPLAKSTVGVFADMSDGFLDVINNSHGVEVAFGALIVTGGIMVGGFLLANAATLLFVAGIGVLLLVVEDLWTSLEGGEGYIADFFTSLIGKEKWEIVIETWEWGTDKIKGFLDGIWSTDYGKLLYESLNPDIMKKMHGNAWASNRNTEMGKLAHRFGQEYSEDDNRGAGIRQYSTPSAGKSSLALDAYAENGRRRGDDFDYVRNAPTRYRGPLLFDDQRSRMGPSADRSEAAFSGVAGEMMSLGGSLDNLAGAVGGLSLPEGDNAGVPLSVPVEPGGSASYTTIRGGDISIMFQGEQSPDTVREARRQASELMSDQNRSLADSASSRE